MRRLILLLLLTVIVLLTACSPALPPAPVPTPKPVPAPMPTPLPTTKPTPTSFPTPAPTPKLVPTSTPAPSPPPSQLTVHFINVGQGDSILLDSGQTEVLIDGGDTSAGANLVSYLSKLVDGPIEAVIATHPHADHIGGLIDILQRFPVDRIYWNGEIATSKTYSDFMALAKAEPQASLEQVKRGDTISISSLVFDVLNPPSTMFKDTNNDSIVLRLTYGDVPFLFTGDAGNDAEASMLASGFNIGANILKVGHHGSKYSSSMPFLKAVSPQIAVYMAGVNNTYGHPHAETIAALNQVGAKVYGTDINGNIVVSTDGQKYTLQLERNVSPPTPPVAATFTTTDLSITPTSVTTTEGVTISVVVTNTGSISGTYPVSLKINNVVVETKSVTLDSGTSQKITFTKVVGGGAGVYTVYVNALSGTFTVRSAPAPATDIVYITRTGAKYHRAGCRYLSQSCIPISRADAISRGYTPCSVCRP